MGLQVGNKSVGRSVLLRFFLYPAVENIPGGIIFYRCTTQGRALTKVILTRYTGQI